MDVTIGQRRFGAVVRNQDDEGEHIGAMGLIPSFPASVSVLAAELMALQSGFQFVIYCLEVANLITSDDRCPV